MEASSEPLFCFLQKFVNIGQGLFTYVSNVTTFITTVATYYNRLPPAIYKEDFDFPYLVPRIDGNIGMHLLQTIIHILLEDKRNYN